MEKVPVDNLFNLAKMPKAKAGKYIADSMEKPLTMLQNCCCKDIYFAKHIEKFDKKNHMFDNCRKIQYKIFKPYCILRKYGI